jgi:hypothetical protein
VALALYRSPMADFGYDVANAKRRVSVPAFLRDLLAEHLAGPLPGGSGPDAFIFHDADRRRDPAGSTPAPCVATRARSSG